MTPYYADDAVTLHHGDCLGVMAALPDNSVDAVVCDPPYGLGFMGREWDDLPPGEEWARECLRVLKPGGHLLAFGGTRTWHRLAVAVEDAGFEVRDSIAWLHGQGFPKGKAQLKPAFEPVVVARKRGPVWLNIDACRVPVPDRAAYEAKCASVVGLDSNLNGSAYGEWTSARENSSSPAGRWPTNVVLDGHAADELDRQSGMSRDGVAVKRNRDGKPQGTSSWSLPGAPREDATYGGQGGASRFFPTFRYEAKAPTAERPTLFVPTCECEDAWPTTSRPRATSATATADGCSTSKSGSLLTGDPSPMGGRSTTSTETSETITQTTSAPSTASPTSASTRAANCGAMNGGSPAASAESSSPSGLPTGTSAAKAGRSTGGAGRATSRVWSATSVCGSCGAPTRREAHATVKPLDLMRWLVRLVTPPGGTVLEPFAGSGTTAEACVIEGFRCIAIEREAAYLPLIVARLSKPIQPDLFGGAA